MSDPILAVETSTYLAAVIAGVISVAGIFVNRWFSRRQDTADATEKEANAAEKITDTAIKLMEPMKQEIAELKRKQQDAEVQRMADEREIQQLKEKIEAVERWAKLLYVQVIEAGLTPMTFEESEQLHNLGR